MKPAVSRPAASSRARCWRGSRTSAWVPDRNTQPRSSVYLSSSVPSIRGDMAGIGSMAIPRAAPRLGGVHHLARVEDAQRVERPLEQAHQGDLLRRPADSEVGLLLEADAVLGRDGAAQLP